MPLLTSVQVVLRAHPQLDALPHVARAVDSFADPSPLWTLESATLKALVHLLDRLAPREHPALSTSFREERFIHNLEQATARGYLEIVQWWLKTYLPGQIGSYWPIISPAIESGQLNVLQWALAQEPSSWVPSSRFRCDHASVVYWVHEQQQLHLRLYSNVDEIVKTGDLAFVKWLAERPEIMTGSCDALVIAMEYGHFDMVKWFVAHRPAFLHLNEYLLSAHGVSEEDFGRHRFDLDDTIKLPEPLETSLGHVRICRWLATEYKWENVIARKTWVQSAMLRASACGSFEMLDILKQLQHFMGADRIELQHCMGVAALYGHFELVKWFQAQGVSFNKHVLDHAAAWGCIEIVRLIISGPRALTRNADCQAMDLAAAHNHLDIVQLLHNHGLEKCCRAKAMDAAAANGHLDIVQWLHEHRTEGCTATAMDDAAENDHLCIMQWLQGNQRERWSTDTLDRAAAGGHLDVVEYLHSHRDIPCTEVGTTAAASNGHLKMVEWLRANRPDSVWTQESIDLAAANGHLDVVIFLAENCELRCSSRATRKVIDAHHFAVAEWVSMH